MKQNLAQKLFPSSVECSKDQSSCHTLQLFSFWYLVSYFNIDNCFTIFFFYRVLIEIRFSILSWLVSDKPFSQIKFSRVWVDVEIKAVLTDEYKNVIFSWGLMFAFTIVSDLEVGIHLLNLAFFQSQRL